MSSKMVLPEGWKIYRFDQLAESINERVLPADANGLPYIGLEHLDSESLKIRRWGSPDEVEAQKLRFYTGDIIFGKRRYYQKKLAVAEFDGICSAHAMVLRAKPDIVLPEFLPFFMQSEMFFERAMSISVGSLSPTINWTALARQEFPLPPLDEQHRIAEILWAIEDTKEAHSHLVDKIKYIKRVYWLHTLTKSNSSTILLGELGTIVNGITPSRANEEYWRSGTIPWLPTGKVHDRVIRSAEEFVTEIALKETSLQILPKGSILIAMIGEGKTRGTTAFLDMAACINQNFACINPNDKIDSWYLFYTLENSYERLRRFSQGSSQSALSCRLLESFQIPLPPIKVQIEIVHQLKLLDEQLTKINLHIASLISLQKQLASEWLMSNNKDYMNVQ